MKNTKTGYPLYSFYDKTGLERYLTEQAEKGWLLYRITSAGWKFRRAEPKKRTFCVTYFPAASAFDPEPSEKELMFRDFCAHAGWVLAASNGQLQVFYNESEEPLPIETDPLLELENIHSAAKKSFLPVLILDLVLGLMQLGLFVWRLKLDAVATLSINANLAAMGLWIVVAGLCTVELLVYSLWYRRALGLARTGGGLAPTRGSTSFQILILLVSLAALAMMLLSLGDRSMTFAVFASMAGILAITLLVLGLSHVMKKWKLSAGENRAITMTLAVVLSLMFSGVLIAVLLGGIHGQMQQEEKETYTYQGYTYTIHRDEIPLKVEALVETDYTEYNYCLVNRQESWLLGVTEARQDPRMDALEEPGMNYRILDVKAGWVYGMAEQSCLERYRGYSSEDIYGNVYHDTYRRSDPAPWGALRAYQLQVSGAGDLTQNYIVCYEDRILQLRFDWEVTPEQMATVGQLLGK